MKTTLKISIQLVVLTTTLFAGSSIFTTGNNLMGDPRYSYSASEMGRGGIAAAMGDSVSLNQMNPAMWAFIPRTTFLVSAGYNSINSEFSGQSLKSSAINFSGGYLAMPLIRKQLAIGFGLLPYLTNDLTTRSQNIGVNEPAYLQITNQGNITQANLNVAYSFNEKYSVALGLRYIFGQIKDEIWLDYSQPGYGDLRYENIYQIHGPGWNLSFFGKLSDKIDAGIKFDSPVNLSFFTKQNSKLTEKNIDDYRKINLPYDLLVGAAYHFTNRWTAGLDFDYQNWKNGYRIDEKEQQNVTNSYRLAAGVEYLPTERKFVSYIEKVTYRAGGYLAKGYSLANNKDVLEYGVSAGLGLPIRGEYNRIDVYSQFGWRGNAADNLAKETIFKIGLSVSAGELWFIREIR